MHSDAMQAPKTFPVEIKNRNATVKIYRINNTKGYEVFRMVWYDADGKRRMCARANYSEAEQEARKLAASFALGQGDTLLLTKIEASIYRAAIAALPSGSQLDIAAREYAAAKGMIGKSTLTEAVDFFVKRNPTSRPHKTVAEVAAEMIEAKKADGVGVAYIRDLTWRLGKFADAFHCDVEDVGVVELNGFLRNAAQGRNRNNYRGIIRTFFRFAVAQGYLAKDHIEFETAIPKASEGQMEIDIFTPEQMIRLLEAAQVNEDQGFNNRYPRHGMVPFLALGAFAGLRTAEIQRQLWSDINLERGFIRVTAAKGNTAQKRLVPISDNLRQWLAPFVKRDGVCCKYKWLAEAVTRVCKRAGVAWKHNALRHSYISYRVAQTQNLPQVSIEAGNSVAMIHRHYRELVRPDEAKTWFAISPQVKENIIPMVAAN
jgi:integrase